jgi:hypothetical protein
LFPFRPDEYNTSDNSFTKEPIMSAPAKLSTLPDVPAEVLAFAAENGVSEWVYPMLEMTARVFAGCPIRLFVECDREDSDWQYIVLEANITVYTSDQVYAAQRQWTHEVAHSFPPQPRQFFIYGIA